MPVGTSPRRHPRPAAPVNKARTSRALVALLVGYAREFLAGLRRPRRRAQEERTPSTRCLSLGEARNSQRARGAARRTESPVHSQEHPGRRAERWRGAWEPLGGAKRGGDRVGAQQMTENYDVMG